MELRRSCLYVPGDSPKMLTKAVGVPADVLLLNLEDGVTPANKRTARKNVTDALQTRDLRGRETIVRINSLDSGTGKDDLAAVVPCRPTGICLPKVERGSDIQAADGAITELERACGITEGSLRIHAMIESASGVLRALEIGLASKRMASLIFGSADYEKDLRCEAGEDRAELLFALQSIVTAARAAGIDAIDAPCFDLRNADLLCSQALQARRLGFEGKSALTPGQVQVINELFAITEAQVAWAEKVLTELSGAEDRGRALTTMDGQLIDNPHKTAAENILLRKRLQESR
jgi:citrate lyase subunit beta / citryl-CoA lyase